MILALYDFKLRLYSEVSLENSITKDWASREKTSHAGRPCCRSGGRAVVLQKWGSSLPQVFCAAKLKNQPPKKDEGILEKYSNSRIHYGLFLSNITSEENPHGCNQGSESQHEANEEPDASSCLAQTAFAVAVTSYLSIRYCVNHEEGYGCYDATGMV